MNLQNNEDISIFLFDIHSNAYIKKKFVMMENRLTVVSFNYDPKLN